MVFYTGQAILEKLIMNTQNMEMIFIGEMPHHHAKVNDCVADLVINWSQNSQFKIYAIESLYCLHPFLQQKQDSDNRFGFINSRIYNYNSTVKEDMKVRLTAIDIAHSIKHSPKLVKNYLEYLLPSIPDKEKENKLHCLINELVEYTDKEDKQDGIKKLQKFIRAGRHFFSDSLFDEWMFYTDMLLATLKVLKIKSKRENNLRNRWFIETIKKALQRRCDNQHKMICHVGSSHGCKEYLNNNDWYVGKTPEAKYFNDSVYINKIYSLFIHPFCFQQGEYKWQDGVEDLVIDKFGTNSTVFVDFWEYQQLQNNPGIEMYYNDGKFQYDGMILVGDNLES